MGDKAEVRGQRAVRRQRAEGFQVGVRSTRDPDQSRCARGVAWRIGGSSGAQYFPRSTWRFHTRGGGRWGLVKLVPPSHQRGRAKSGLRVSGNQDDSRMTHGQTVIPMRDGDGGPIAAMHRDGIPSGFLSTVPPAFLAALYRSIAADRESVVLVDTQGGLPIGFVAATCSTGGLYRRVILRQWYRFGWQLLPLVVNPRAVWRILETLTYPLRARNRGDSDPTHSSPGDGEELLAIATLTASRGQGVGRRLIRAVDHWMIQRGVRRYSVVTWAEDSKSNGFYCATGFSLTGTFQHHGNHMNRYVRILSPRDDR
jgi:GNAT superfamily N-acetyltransferase